MQYRKFGTGFLRVLFGFAFCFFCLSSWQLSAQSSIQSGSLPDWLMLPKIQAQPENDQRPLVLKLADSVGSWNKWSIEVEGWYQTLKATVIATLNSSDKHAQALTAENDALKLENSLLRSQIKNQIEVGLLSGAGGLIGGLALGLWAGASIPK